ncbi:MAG: hypothetical protein ABEJ24_03995 [Candidatus Magasanikbacteria bacterium]
MATTIKRSYHSLSELHEKGIEPDEDLEIALTGDSSHNSMNGQTENLKMIWDIAAAAGVEGKLKATDQKGVQGEGHKRGFEEIKIIKPSDESRTVTVEVQSGGSDTCARYPLVPTEKFRDEEGNPEIHKFYEELKEGKQRCLGTQEEKTEQSVPDFSDEAIAELVNQTLVEADGEIQEVLLSVEWDEEGRPVCTCSDDEFVSEIKEILGDYISEMGSEEVIFYEEFSSFFSKLREEAPDKVLDLYQSTEPASLEEERAEDTETEAEKVEMEEGVTETSDYTNEENEEEIPEFPSSFRRKRSHAFKDIFAQMGVGEEFKTRDVELDSVYHYDEYSDISSILHKAAKTKVLENRSVGRENEYWFIEEFVPEELLDARRDYMLDNFESEKIVIELGDPTQFNSSEEILEEMGRVDEEISRADRMTEIYIEILSRRNERIEERRKRTRQLLKKAKETAEGLDEDLAEEIEELSENL